MDNPAGPPVVDVSIILPTYNERANICDLIDAIAATLAGSDQRYEVVVVDDNSPDGTAEEVQKLIKKDKNIHLIVRNRWLESW